MKLRDQIINSKPETKPIQAFGTTVHLRRMSGADTLGLHRWQTEHEDRTGLDVMCQMLVRTICDENGERQFEDTEADLIAAKAYADIQRLFEVTKELNGISDEDVEEAAGN